MKIQIFNLTFWWRYEIYPKQGVLGKGYFIQDLNIGWPCCTFLQPPGSFMLNIWERRKEKGERKEEKRTNGIQERRNQMDEEEFFFRSIGSWHGLRINSFFFFWLNWVSDTQTIESKSKERKKQSNNRSNARIDIFHVFKLILLYLLLHRWHYK